MNAFAQLIEALDSTNKTNEKVALLATYFRTAPQSDALWAVALFSHRRPSRPVSTSLLREWAAELAGLSPWLFEEAYHIVGDLAETIALLLSNSQKGAEQSLAETITDIIALKPKKEQEKKNYIQSQWQQLTITERFVFNKIITGSFRIGISQKLMTRALGQALELDENTLAHRLMGTWTPQTTTFEDLLITPHAADQLSRPYPFYLAYAVEDDFFKKHSPDAYCVEHKWDGMRGQLIVREGQYFLWSRGEELITNKFPELAPFANHLPSGTVLDGEILPYPQGVIGNFNDLQKRIGRKTVGAKLLQDVPIRFMIYDLLEWEGIDYRTTPLHIRQEQLALLYQSHKKFDLPWELSQVLNFATWEAVAQEREKAEQKRSEGLMLKKKDSSYAVGRKKGSWWKWKSDPKTIDAVLTFAMRGHGRRTNLYTDYTFALWDEGKLITFTKAYSGLTDKEIREVDRYVKQNTLARFGPVREVTPKLVFEIAFEGVAPSTRHKSGVAVRFPRILRWRHDKKIEAANSLGDLKKLLS